MTDEAGVVSVSIIPVLILTAHSSAPRPTCHLPVNNLVILIPRSRHAEQ